MDIKKLMAQPEKNRIAVLVERHREPMTVCVVAVVGVWAMVKRKDSPWAMPFVASVKELREANE